MPSSDKIEICFAACLEILGPENRALIFAACGREAEPDAFIDVLNQYLPKLKLPEFVIDLARLEKTIYDVRYSAFDFSRKVETLEVNPSVHLLELSWTNLLSRIDNSLIASAPEIKPGRELVLIWKQFDSGAVKYKVPMDEEILALKMVVEGLESERVALQGDLHVAKVDAALDRATDMGILRRPSSLLCRNIIPEHVHQPSLTTDAFAIQWHITQACDLHCKHCYDRSKRSSLQYDAALKILDDLYRFCRDRYVSGHVIFTGGNPLLYPEFLNLYQEASERNLRIAILGNPCSQTWVEDLIAIQKPRFFQVSLEGLPEHNDLIRGKGHFERVLAFLGLLRELDVYSMVMLTLTRDNMGQVLPLCEMLRPHTDAFYFNRLSMVGEGAKLQLPSPEDYESFLGKYLEASETNSIMGLKDSLFNIIKHRKGMPLFDGCTGYGCGAGFNFVSILSDGQVHACRKFPSPMGNILDSSLAEIYDSAIAEKIPSGKPGL